MPTHVDEETGRLVTTLLELVVAVSASATTDAETEAVVHHLLRSGRVRLVGQFTEADFPFAA